jgi:cytochrome c oxidase assembly protein subunit 15
MDFAHGFSLWRDLGQTADGRGLPFAALTAVHWVHRNFAFVIFAVTGYLAWKIRKDNSLRSLANGVFFMLAWQLLTGLSNIFFKWPLSVALMHNAGAAILLLLCTFITARLSKIPVSKNETSQF